jgi:hypothetical protein
VSTGTIENVGLANVNMTGTFDVAGLVGDASSGSSTILNSYVTGTVNGGTGGGQIGGLAGENDGTITSSYSTAAVSGNYYVGGLVGYDATTTKTVSDSYATGAVTGAGSGSTEVGGLIGWFESGTLSQVYATGAVSGNSAVGGLIGETFGGSSNKPTISYAYAMGSVNVSGSGGGDGGGLIGLWGTDTGAITQTYAIGLVTATNGASTTTIGGWAGAKSGSGSSTPTDSYWNSATTNQSKGVGSGSATGTTTKTASGLQTSLSSLSFTNTIWGLIPNVSYPYFLWQYPTANGTPQVISGIAYSNLGTTVLTGGTVTELVNGLGNLTSSTGGDGSYYFLLPANTISASGSQVLTYTSGATAGAAYQQNATGSVSGLNIDGTYLTEYTPAAAYSSVVSGLSTAIGSNSAAQTLVSSLANQQIDPTASSFAIDQSISTGTLVLSTTGTVNQSAAITTTNLDLLGSGGTYVLTGTSNSIGTVAANTGAVDVNDGSALSTGAVGGTAGVTGTGAITLVSGGNLTIASGDGVKSTGTGVNGAVVLVADGTFTNNAGVSGVKAGSGATYTIYSQNASNPSGALPSDSFGGLTGTDWYNDAYSFVFQNPNTGNLIHVGFTPNGPNTANNDNGVNPASLPPGDQFTHNNGFDFAPISQYDENQYSDFKLPDYDNDDSEAAILTILARGASPGHAQDYMIDNFWNGSEATWPGAGHINLSGKLTFSDGAGHNVTPTNDNGFPIVAGKTDFAALLKNGPVMIGGPPGQTPAQWLLATGMTPDGKDIICDDPATGGLVELAYDPATETVGGITGVFNPKTKGFIALADAGTDIPANDASGLAGLQSFVPSTYYAVTVH